MTLVVALEGKDGLVLAADSRSTINDQGTLKAKNDGQTKIFRLSQYCAVGISGISEIAAQLLDEMQKRITVESIDDVMQESRDLIRRRYNKWFKAFPLVEKRPVVSFTIIGLNKTNEGRQKSEKKMYQLTSRLDWAPMLNTTGFVFAGSFQYAHYLCLRLYRREMEIKQLCDLAAYLITETASQDLEVGGPTNIVKIDDKTGFTQVPAKEVVKIIEKNCKHNEELQSLFFTR
ncbi:MAG TPA: hypothetical protein ENI11_02340 [Actinobacteria bacterium]|nr:hypothetical protein [Actinomycetota bacterium]